MDDHVLVEQVNHESCIHCGAPIPASRRGGNGAAFCCHGCQTVYGLLHDQGLDYFYQLRESGGVLRPEDQQAPAALNDSIGAFDDLIFAPV